LPHSEIPGSPIARISPGLFAACHVLHRLSVPRHPPDALTSRLITGLRVAAETAQNRRAQGQTPPGQSPRAKSQASRYARDRRPRMKTLLSDTAGTALPAPSQRRQTASSRGRHAAPAGRCPPRSQQLSLHPSINPPSRSPATGSLASPSQPAPPARRRHPPGSAARCSTAAPAGRQGLALPVVEVNGFEPMTSCLQSRRSPS
jgi:hypothetical protein